MYASSACMRTNICLINELENAINYYMSCINYDMKSLIYISLELKLI